MATSTETLNDRSFWNNIEARLAGKLEVKLHLLSEHPNDSFDVKRSPGFDHSYHCVRKSDGAWAIFNYFWHFQNRELVGEVSWRGGTFE